MRHVVLMLFPLASLAALAGCGPDYSPNTYASAAVQQANKADQGVVIGVRRVDVSAAGTVGAAVGASAGGIAGSTTAGGVGSAFGALGGALVGGIVGTAAEHGAADTFAYEYIVKKTSGELVSVTQKDTTPLAISQKVLVIAGSQARIVPDYTVTVDVPAKPDASKADATAKDAAGKDAPGKLDSNGKTAHAGTEPPPDPVLLAPLPPPSTQASVDKAGLPIQIAPPPVVPPTPSAASVPPADAAAASAGTAAALAATGTGPAPAPSVGMPAVPVAPTGTTPPAKAQ